MLGATYCCRDEEEGKPRHDSGGHSFSFAVQQQNNASELTTKNCVNFCCGSGAKETFRKGRTRLCLRLSGFGGPLQSVTFPLYSDSETFPRAQSWRNLIQDE